MNVLRVGILIFKKRAVVYRMSCFHGNTVFVLCSEEYPAFARPVPRPLMPAAWSGWLVMTSKVYELDLHGQKIERIENLEKVRLMSQCKCCTCTHLLPSAAQAPEGP